MTDKGGVAASQDYGKDEASVEKLLTKHNALETDVLAHSGIIQGLAENARRLVQSGHFDGAKIAARQVSFPSCVGQGDRVDYLIFLHLVDTVRSDME